jgi:hypothetical protein
VKIDDYPAVIHEVRPSEGGGYYPQENTALVRIVSSFSKLKIEVSTGEKATPELNRETNTFYYNVYFNLSKPEDRQIERTLFISASGQNDAPYEYDLGVLTPKQALEIAVIVINGSTCYATERNLAQQSYVNGNFSDAYQAYQNLLETDLCNEDKPADLSALKADMEKAGKYMILMDSVSLCRTKSESFYEENRLDSCLYYLNAGTRITSEIAKDHPLNEECKKQNRMDKEFRKKNLGRIVSGKIYLDAGTDHPVGNTLITVSKHERKMKKIGGALVPVPGKEIKGAYRKTYNGNADGSFMVSVPEEPQGESKTIYVVHFVAESGQEILSAEHVPGDRITIPDLHITLTSGKK